MCGRASLEQETALARLEQAMELTDSIIPSRILAIEALEGAGAARRFLRYSRAGYSPIQSALGYFHIWRSGGDKPLSKLESDKWDHDIADSKGHWFYHMTRARLGDEAFFAAMRSILRDFSGREATVDDLRRAFIAVSDDPALPHFLEQ